MCCQKGKLTSLTKAKQQGWFARQNNGCQASSSGPQLSGVKARPQSQAHRVLSSMSSLRRTLDTYMYVSPVAVRNIERNKAPTEFLMLSGKNCALITRSAQERKKLHPRLVVWHGNQFSTRMTPLQPWYIRLHAGNHCSKE